MLKTSTALVLGTTLLCFSQWMSDVAATPGLGADCPCPHRSNTKVKLSRVVDYSIQHEGICPVRVLMVHTVSGRILCSNPDTKWAEMVRFKVQMDRVTKELQENPLITAGPSGTITPTPAPTPETDRILTKERLKCLKKLQKKNRRGKKQRICP
ncbi:hypothetical protein D4764_15G0000730 [Takifugu flavidus]|uniref:Chemokine interleukin-8-like domain-containing protein n=1 Tax=Takifugu flavidus TaxID=433684 RepID=A0A5C6P1A1_9TELE|nr:hypothetical protein D4764_15G0000730 [Takifugu flavidus]